MKVIFENVLDSSLVEAGTLSADRVHRAEFDEVAVDPAVTHLEMPASLIKQLDLMAMGCWPSETSAGIRKTQFYGAVRLRMEGREGTLGVAEVPDGYPVVIGMVPLGVLDLVVDPETRRVIGNPAHGGEPMIELY